MVLMMQTILFQYMDHRILFLTELIVYGSISDRGGLLNQSMKE
jgi:hypothetical protein